MIVFRIENDNGQGPYHWGHALMWSLNSNKPLPSEDPILQEIFNPADHEQFKDFRFGFTSLDQLRAWFEDEELLNLEKIGFKIKTFDICDKLVVPGKTQVLFKKG